MRVERWRAYQEEVLRFLQKSMRSMVTSSVWAAFLWMIVGCAFGAVIALGVGESLSGTSGLCVLYQVDCAADGDTAGNAAHRPAAAGPSELG